MHRVSSVGNNANSNRPRKEKRLRYVLSDTDDTKHCAGINCLAVLKSSFSDGCNYLFTGSRDGTLKRWALDDDAATCSATFESHVDWVNDTVIAGDNTLVSCSSDTTLKTWNCLSDGICTSTLRQHSDYVTCLAAAEKNTNVVASGGLGGEVFVWDIEAAVTPLSKSSDVLEDNCSNGINGSANSLSISSLRTISSSNSIAAQTAQCHGYVPICAKGHKESVYALAINDSGSLLVSGGTEKVVRVWDPRTGLKTMKLRGHTDNIRALLMDSTGRYCLSGSSDSMIRLWDLGQQRCVHSYAVHMDSVWALASTPTFSHVYSGGRDLSLYLTDLTTRESLLLCTKEHPILQLALHGDSIWVATTDSSVHRWPAEGKNPQKVFQRGGSFLAGNLSFSRARVSLEGSTPAPVYKEPIFTIPGTPAIVHYEILNNRRHVLTKEQESGKMIGTTKVNDGLYVWNKNSSQEGMALSTSKDDPIMLWHRRLGHPNFMYLKKLFPLLFLNKKISSLNCEVCQLSKHTCVPYPLKPYVQSQPFSLIHSDLWGASRVKNITGARWFITFIDDHTRVCWVYLLKEKSEVSRVFKNFHSMIRTQFNSNIHTLRTDNGREYFNSILSPYLSEQGIIHQSSCPDTPQQNGVSERKNRHLVAVARALMFTMGVPKYLWGEAVLTACYLINRLPSKYTDEEVEQCYEEFYEDVHTEFLKFGEIVNFKVCKNGSFHLRGNVYVHYKSLESAVLAYDSINGRYFAGKQVKCEFVNITRWKVAICGEFMKSRLKTCSRGTACNFIHCFRNPGGDYEWADWDKPPPRYWMKKMAALFGYGDEAEFEKQREQDNFGHLRNPNHLVKSVDDRHRSRRSISRERGKNNDRKQKKDLDGRCDRQKTSLKREQNSERILDTSSDGGYSESDIDGARDTDKIRSHFHAKRNSKWQSDSSEYLADTNRVYEDRECQTKKRRRHQSKGEYGGSVFCIHEDDGDQLDRDRDSGKSSRHYIRESSLNDWGASKNKIHVSDSLVKQLSTVSDRESHHHNRQKSSGNLDEVLGPDDYGNADYRTHESNSSDHGSERNKGRHYDHQSKRSQHLVECSELLDAPVHQAKLKDKRDLKRGRHSRHRYEEIDFSDDREGKHHVKRRSHGHKRQ